MVWIFGTFKNVQFFSLKKAYCVFVSQLGKSSKLIMKKRKILDLSDKVYQKSQGIKK
jgi:hypothetical protein